MPEHVSGNMYKLGRGECFTGHTDSGEVTICGPLIVRVDEFPEDNLLIIQARNDLRVQAVGQTLSEIVRCDQSKE